MATFLQPEPNATQLQRLVKAALRAWHTPGGTAASLLQGLLLVYEQRHRLTEADGPSALRLATNRVLLDGLERLELLDTTEVEALRSHYLQKLKSVALANRLKRRNRDQVNRLLAQAIRHLAEILVTREQAARAAWIIRQEAFLECAQYAELFGVDHLLADLTSRLQRDGAPWLFAVTGLGGIGKTALADALARGLMRNFAFEQVAWVRVNPQTPSAPEQTYKQVIVDLTARLYPQTSSDVSFREALIRLRLDFKQRAHLLVVDNVEGVADADYLLERLAELTNPSKVLLTSRARPSGQLSAYVLDVAELPQAEAVTLLRHHAASLGEAPLAEASDADLQPVYRVVGGNALALRLVAGLARGEALSQVLADLQQGRPGEPADLYRRIYLKTWQTLSAPARALLQAMPLVAEVGGTPEHLRAASGLDEAAFWPALHELIGRSLLEARGTLHAKRYGIHRLTTTFLHTDIIGWAEDAPQ